MTDVAIAHWGESVNGGGERVAWELARTFNAPLYVSVRNKAIEPDDVEVKQLFDGLTERLGKRGGLSHMAANQFGWEIAQPLRDYDVLISSGNEVLSYVPPTEQTWIHYVHHTSRNATDLLPTVYERKDGTIGKYKAHLERVIRKIERQIYTSYATKPDVLVANSEVVANRVASYWGRTDTEVIYPPVPVADYGADAESTEDYYLVLSRLDWHKAIDDIIAEFANRDKTLVIAGSGSEREYLEKLATSNVQFEGYVSEARKQGLLAGAKAVINNAYAEDFGLTTVEPLASGTPVIGVREGMTQHLIRDGINGFVYDRGKLSAAIDRCESEGVIWSDRQIERFANQFSVQEFHDKFHLLVNEAMNDTEVSISWDLEKYTHC